VGVACFDELASAFSVVGGPKLRDRVGDVSGGVLN
jgi:hypothetical protein